MVRTEKTLPEENSPDSSSSSLSSSSAMWLAIHCVLPYEWLVLQKNFTFEKSPSWHAELEDDESEDCLDLLKPYAYKLDN